jgi:hypothetical protein
MEHVIDPVTAGRRADPFRLRWSHVSIVFVFTICLAAWAPEFAITIGGANLRPSQVMLPCVGTLLLVAPSRRPISLWAFLSLAGALTWWLSLGFWTAVQGPDLGNPMAHLSLMALNLLQALVTYGLVMRMGSPRPIIRALFLSTGVLNVALLVVGALPSLGIAISDQWLFMEPAPMLVNGAQVGDLAPRLSGGVVLGCVSASVAIMAIALWFDRTWRSRLLLGVAGATAMLGIIVGYSRQSVLSLALGLIVIGPFLVWRMRARRVVQLLAVSLLAVGALGVVLFTIPQGRQFWYAFAGRASLIVDPNLAQHGTVVGRVELWRQILNESFQQPFIGHGQDAFMVFIR